MSKRIIAGMLEPIFFLFLVLSFLSPDVCMSISNLCKDSGCQEPSELCRKAAEAVGAGEEAKYLELCAQSCVKCGESRKPREASTNKPTTYVA